MNGTYLIMVIYLTLAKMLIINYTLPDCDTSYPLLYKFNNELIASKVNCFNIFIIVTSLLFV